MKEIVVVGGLPSPIGGVTTFISRLVRVDNSVGVLFDLYPSRNKQLPEDYVGDYIYSKFKFITLLKLFLFSAVRREINVHFNFSTPRSLILLKWLPKRRSTWALTLHHGDLGEAAPWMVDVFKKKVDVALPLNLTQERWYSNLNAKKIVCSSSYLPASKPRCDYELQAEIGNYKARYERILVCSGYPTKIYNHEKAFQLMSKRPKDLLICCIYGPGELRNRLKAMAHGQNIVVKDSLSEERFNYLLNASDLYIRLNSEDSFGIAVADAINFGVRVVATDVCIRYPGAVTVSSEVQISDLNNIVQRTLDSPIVEVYDGKLPRFEYKKVFK
ncbi:glycosyltransferase [Pseudomonas corrugata]|uniref:glycosyltransferase n=1 Tax=Pseudomonas corrugata TaxID=47879 RepID=UPI002234B359|nr:glycosyltransferase [Pseudomonas corrugata]UZE07938.1 glycosyltransferase [Pseudomonas corrugata]